jgi:serine/threonine protein kinase
MKELLKGSADSPAAFHQAVLREVAILFKLRGHPAVVGLVGYTPPLSGSNAAFVYMQYMVNDSLERGIYRTTPSPTVRAKWALGLAMAIRFFHRREVIHRDIKPGNVLLDERNEVCIGDFGSSKNESTLTSQSRAAGTLWYVAPELHIVGGDCEYDAAVDVYSFGIVLWEIIRGERPYADHPVSNAAQEAVFLAGVREAGWRPRLDGLAGWMRDMLGRLWGGAPAARGTMDEAVATLAANHYAIVPGVDTAALQEYRTRLEAAEAALELRGD